jgi:Asp/Glu/hydantoin racemase
MGAAIEASRPFVNIPVLRVDQPMVDEALNTGRKIGVAATLLTTLEPTVELARARAKALERSDIEVITRLCDGAFEAVMSGDTAKHDELVTAGLIDLAQQVDVIILAQASMARVAESLPADATHVPILSSPRSGLQAVADALQANP